MVLQNIIFPDAVCPIEDIYFRLAGNAKLNSDSVFLPAGTSVSTNTYMNAFDIGSWLEDTTAKTFTLTVLFQGKGRFSLRYLDNRNGQTNEQILQEEIIESASETMEKFHFEIPKNLSGGTCFWEIHAIRDSVFRAGSYSTDTIPFRSDIRLAVNICTFHREKQLADNLKKFMDSAFFQKSSRQKISAQNNPVVPGAELYGSMHVFVIDNGNSFTSDPVHPNIHIHPNSNKGGGSGGFTRGLEEIRKLQSTCSFSHVVFMDDDVEFQMESFYRLFAYLSYLKREKQMTSVAGRMFRLDDRKIQYTGIEIWNKGNIRHAGGNLDMSISQNAMLTTALSGDYGGWWFCTYPAEFALENCPFPFFIHCDDVEYGLRFPGRVTALRGVQVWHETYEYRVTPRIIYYDIRNPMVVNALHGLEENANEMIEKWQERLEEFHREGDQTLKYLCILAMYHFTKGYRFFQKGGKLPGMHNWMKDRTELLKFVNPVFHRYVSWRLKMKNSYANILHTYKIRKEKLYGC